MTLCVPPQGRRNTLSRRFDNLGFFFSRLRGSRLELLGLTLVKILDLKVAVSLAVHLRAALHISL